MYPLNLSLIAAKIGVPPALMMATILVLMIWTLIWKGWALWISARQGSKVWFIVLLLINTVGILEILYIFLFSKRKNRA